MAEKKLFEIRVTGVQEALMATQQAKALLYLNLQEAVVRTTLYAVTLIASKTPVDTGRLRASIAGELAGTIGIELDGDHKAIIEGEKNSTTLVEPGNLHGHVGSNVSYALHVEYGHKVNSTRRVGTESPKGQAVDVRVANRTFRYVKGRGMFRTSKPEIEKYFHDMVNKAIQATSEGKRL